MVKVLFVCHGNICRSPMAEFVFRDMVEKAGLAGRFTAASAATSREELGNPVSYTHLRYIRRRCARSPGTASIRRRCTGRPPGS